MKLLGKGVGVCLCVCGWLKKKLLTSHQVALPRSEFSEHDETSVHGCFRKSLIFKTTFTCKGTVH